MRKTSVKEAQPCERSLRDPRQYEAQPEAVHHRYDSQNTSNRYDGEPVPIHLRRLEEDPTPFIINHVTTHPGSNTSGARALPSPERFDRRTGSVHEFFGVSLGSPRKKGQSC